MFDKIIHLIISEYNISPVYLILDTFGIVLFISMIILFSCALYSCITETYED
jgi:hypothetical protein